MPRVCIVGDFSELQIKFIMKLRDLEVLPELVVDRNLNMGKTITQGIIDDFIGLDNEMLKVLNPTAPSREERRSKKKKNGVPRIGRIKPITKV